MASEGVSLLLPCDDASSTCLRILGSSKHLSGSLPILQGPEQGEICVHSTWLLGSDTLPQAKFLDQ